MTAAFRPWLLIALASLLTGCWQADEPETALDDDRQITVAVLPDEAPARQRQKYAPLLQSIRGSSGLEARLVIPESYGDLLRLFADGEVDLAFFGGYTFTLANRQHGAIPLVMRDIDANFVSYVLVPQDSPASGLEDLAGARFSFGSRLSTSGHVMPRYFFGQLGVTPETLFGEVVYSGAHDRTFQWVADGTVDAGVLNGQIARDLLATADATRVRILWQSPPYVDYVWAVHPSVSEPTRNALLSAFLSFSSDDPEQARFLTDIGASYFLPAANSDFERLHAAIGMLPAEALKER